MWKEENKKLKKTFKFKDFISAFSWMTKVAFHAEKLDHHPDWKNVYNTVEVELSTHSAGNVTDKDRKLAAIMDEMYLEKK